MRLQDPSVNALPAFPPPPLPLHRNLAGHLKHQCFMQAGAQFFSTTRQYAGAIYNWGGRRGGIQLASLVTVDGGENGTDYTVPTLFQASVSNTRYSSRVGRGREGGGGKGGNGTGLPAPTYLET